MGFQDNIKWIRNRFGLDQERIAEIAGVTKQSVSVWELGKGDPRIGAAKKIAAHFGIQLSDVIGDVDMEEVFAKRKISHAEANEILDLTDERIFERFDVQFDGEPLSKEDAAFLLAVLRAHRSSK